MAFRVHAVLSILLLLAVSAHTRSAPASSEDDAQPADSVSVADSPPAITDWPPSDSPPAKAPPSEKQDGTTVDSSGATETAVSKTQSGGKPKTELDSEDPSEPSEPAGTNPSMPVDAQLTRGSASSTPPSCAVYVRQGLVARCKVYTASKDGETLKTVAGKTGADATLLRLINPQITDSKMRVQKGQSINVPA